MFCMPASNLDQVQILVKADCIRINAGVRCLSLMFQYFILQIYVWHDIFGITFGKTDRNTP